MSKISKLISMVSRRFEASTQIPLYDIDGNQIGIISNGEVVLDPEDNSESIRLKYYKKTLFEDASSIDDFDTLKDPDLDEDDSEATPRRSKSSILWKERPPLTVQELLDNTDSERLRKAEEEVRVADAKTKLVVVKSDDGTKDVAMVLFTIHTRNIINKHRYAIYILLPYFKNYTKKNLLTLPVKCYSSSPDFIYRFAYLYNKSNNLYLTPKIAQALEKAIKEPPVVRTPDGVRQLDKHLACALLNLNKIKVKVTLPKPKRTKSPLKVKKKA